MRSLGQNKDNFTSRRKKVPFSMAMGNVNLMYGCKEVKRSRKKKSRRPNYISALLSTRGSLHPEAVHELPN